MTVQAQILDLLHTLRTETGMALPLVTHGLGAIAGTVDDVLVMSRGEAVERGPVAEVLAAPRHPYTRSLLAAVPRVDTARPALVRRRVRGWLERVGLDPDRYDAAARPPRAVALSRA